MTKLSGKRKGTICCILKLAVVLVLTMSTLRDNTRVATLTHPMSENDSSYSPVATRQESFALALKQSYGFFTDITETQWRLAQTIHAKTFPNQFREYPSEYSGGTFLERHDKTIESHKWYAENFHEEFQCAGARRIPSRANGDGAKWICDPHRIAQQQDCLVYSFGSFGNTDFEHGIKEEIGEHCEIHTFDVLTHNLENGNFEERLRSVGAYFHRWGLRTEDQAGASPRSPTSVPMYTLKQIIQMLNHTSRVIDIFRIDCEWCEWDIFPQALQAGDIRQILVEVRLLFPVLLV